MAEAVTRLYANHDDVLSAIERVRTFLSEAYLADEATCPPGDWTMGCAGCQARMLDLQLDMLRRDVEGDSVRKPAA